jgi:hypothetical protein
MVTPRGRPRWLTAKKTQISRRKAAGARNTSPLLLVVLLPQPHGFEGSLAVIEDSEPCHFAVGQRPDGGVRRLHRHAAGPTHFALTNAHDDVLSAVNDVLNLEVHFAEGRESLTPRLADTIMPSVNLLRVKGRPRRVR